MNYDQNNICEYCHYGKQHRLKFQISETATADIFDILHADIWGSFSVASVHGHVDDHSRHTWVFLMKNKSETRSLFNDFVK